MCGKINQSWKSPLLQISYVRKKEKPYYLSQYGSTFLLFVAENILIHAYKMKEYISKYQQ